MKSLSKKTRTILIVGSLLLIAFFAGISLTGQAARAQTEATPTPTPQIIDGNPVLESGDTEGLILGAGIILVIILGGVIIQRAIIKNNSQTSPHS